MSNKCQIMFFYLFLFSGCPSNVRPTRRPSEVPAVRHHPELLGRQTPDGIARRFFRAATGSWGRSRQDDSTWTAFYQVQIPLHLTTLRNPDSRQVKPRRICCDFKLHETTVFAFDRKVMGSFESFFAVPPFLPVAQRHEVEKVWFGWSCRDIWLFPC